MYKDRHEILGKVIAGDALGASNVELSQFGEIVRKYIDNIPNSNPNVTVSQYIIMPNHIHIILIFNLMENSGAPRAAYPTMSH